MQSWLGVRRPGAVHSEGGIGSGLEKEKDISINYLYGADTLWTVYFVQIPDKFLPVGGSSYARVGCLSTCLESDAACSRRQAP